MTDDTKLDPPLVPSNDGCNELYTKSIEQTDLGAILDFNFDFDQEETKNMDPGDLTKSASPDPFTGIFNPSGTGDVFTPPGLDPACMAKEEVPELKFDFTALSYQSNSAPGFVICGPPHHPAGRQRSISEPPDAFALHHHRVDINYQPSVTFHRDGHRLGEPQSRTLKSMPKAKASVRHQPYKTKATVPSVEQRRNHLRGTLIQPIRSQPPTSVPSIQSSATSQTISTQVMIPPSVPAFSALPSQSPVFVSTRVCTPVPEEMPSPQLALDPMLREVASLHAAGTSATAVTVSITVDELKDMIVEAVKQAMGGLVDGVDRAGVPEEEDVVAKQSRDVEAEEASN